MLSDAVFSCSNLRRIEQDSRIRPTLYKTIYKHLDYKHETCELQRDAAVSILETVQQEVERQEIGSPGVVSEILNGKRELNKRQIKALSERFMCSPAVFM